MSAIHQSWLGKPKRSKWAGMKQRMARMEDLEPRWLCTVSAIDHSYTTNVGQTLTVLATDGLLSGASTTATPAILLANWTSLPEHGVMLWQMDGGFQYTPDSTFVGMVTVPFSVSDTNFDSVTRMVTISITANAPVLSELSVTYGDDRSVTLSGTVAADDMTMLTVDFSGVASGSVTVSSDGSFTYTTTATGVGIVTAQANRLGLSSNMRQIMLAPPVPVLESFTIQQPTLSLFDMKTVTFSGSVTTSVGQVSTLIVSFCGEVTTMAAPSFDGTFEKQLTMPRSQEGVVICMVVDDWGNYSNAIQANLIAI